MYLNNLADLIVIANELVTYIFIQSYRATEVDKNEHIIMTSRQNHFINSGVVNFF